MEQNKIKPLSELARDKYIECLINDCSKCVILSTLPPSVDYIKIIDNFFAQTNWSAKFSNMKLFIKIHLVPLLHSIHNFEMHTYLKFKHNPKKVYKVNANLYICVHILRLCFNY